MADRLAGRREGPFVSVGLYVMNEKGLAVTRSALSFLDRGLEISHITTAPARGMEDDSDKEISRLGKEAGIPVFSRAHPPDYKGTLSIAAGWRWMLGINNLVVLHDSLLPRYRGHSPLITALLNGEPEVGVTAFMARDEPDTGPIITQRSMPVAYPTRMREVLNRIVHLYGEITDQMFDALVDGAMLTYAEQDHTKATYSLWRTELDYRIDWSWDAHRIKRLIDAASDPYPGAWTTIAEHPEDHWTGRIVRILDARIIDDKRIEDRRPGKVFNASGLPPFAVVCGTGMIEITEMELETLPTHTRFV